MDDSFELLGHALEIEINAGTKGEFKDLPLRSLDVVNHPPHYTSGKVECIDAIEAALTAEEFRGYCKGNALKYVWRERLKGKDEDLKKAGFYLRKLHDEFRTN